MEKKMCLLLKLSVNYDAHSKFARSVSFFPLLDFQWNAKLSRRCGNINRAVRPIDCIKQALMSSPFSPKLLPRDSCGHSLDNLLVSLFQPVTTILGLAGQCSFGTRNRICLAWRTCYIVRHALFTL